jgi:ubiquinol-cytochrome c reductase cytochrome b subunit
VRRILRWIDEQTELVSIIKHFLEEPLPKGTGWPHIFGSAALFMFAVQAATGIFLMVYSVPSPENAYETVQYIQHRVAFGELVRGIHHWGASAMLLMVGLHMLQTYFWGAYKRPRQIIWVLGVGLLLLTMVFGFTGYLLPWDQKAYWATVVGTNIAGIVPVIGAWVRDLIRGTATVGAITLTRFFALHVFFLPVALTALFVFHLFQVRKKGLTPSWRRVGEEAGVEHGVVFYPDQALKDAVFAVILLGAVMMVAWRVGAPIEPVANPADTAYVPRPEWYFLWLFQLLKYFPGKLEFVGAVLLPAVAVLLLVLFPYVDRSRERLPRLRPFATALAVGTFLGVSALGIMAVVTAPREEHLTPLQERGQKIFMDLRCNECHGINGGGGNAGPDLAQGGPYKLARVEKVIVNPTAFNPRSIMPKANLPPEQMRALANYVSSLNPRSRMPFMPALGPKRPPSHLQENWFVNHKFEVLKDPSYCATCHKRSFCYSCHQNRRPDSHLVAWLKNHYGVATERPGYCQVCHNKSFCEACHKNLLHGKDWLTVHGQRAPGREAICAQCHDAPLECETCHRGARPKSHGAADWLTAHGKVAAANRSQCMYCHQPSDCQRCHGAPTPPKAAPQAKPGAAKPVPAPAAFHENCEPCHGPDGHGNAAMAAALGNLDLSAAASLSPDDISKIIRQGKGAMPSFTELTDEDVRKLAAYVRTLGGKK